ncbi:hypothetical protein HYDPIDRAFT_165611 [Hydnomerulius pinastri MD-312]|nr:hypothetical protein HYDPIDRAFT_165611 [Hydnomerulius pinastri MD-312]
MTPLNDYTATCLACDIRSEGRNQIDNLAITTLNGRQVGWASMTENPPPPDQQQSFSASNIVPRLVRSFSKPQATTQPSTSTESAEGSTPAPTPWISRQTATAIGHFSKLARKDKAPEFPPASWFREGRSNGTDPAEGSSQRAEEEQTHPEIPANEAETAKNDCVVEEGEAVEPATLAKKIQDMFFTIPSLPSTISASTSRFMPSPSLPSEVGTDGPPPTPAPGPLINYDPKLLAFLTSSSVMNGSLERGRQSVWSALDRLRPPFGKKPDATSPEIAEDTVLDCLDDNNSVMMYGPLEPDDSSEVEIACSEIVSVNGDGEEIRTPQPSYVPLPPESIEQVLMGGTEDFDRGEGKGREHDFYSETSTFVGPEQPFTSAEPAAEELPVKEYRVWLPSLTKISVQTMWWGFRIYLPPPVLDVLNNKQLEAAKRAAMITAALKWLLDHLPVALLPPQMRPGVAILRRLVPYLGYIGGFIAWGWSGIKTFDKGYGVVLTATWLLPIALIPGTWELEEFPALNMDPQPSSSASP